MFDVCNMSHSAQIIANKLKYVHFYERFKGDLLQNKHFVI